MGSLFPCLKKKLLNKKEYKVDVKKVFKHITIIGFTILLLFTISSSIGFSIRSQYFRELSERYRAELDTATATNIELGKQLTASRRVIEDCRRQTTELGESVNRNIQTARDAIELVREIREKVILLESRLDSSNNDPSSNDSSTLSDEVK